MEIADREADMRRNVAESEEADKKKAEREKEFKKNFEATRQKRTDVSFFVFDSIFFLWKFLLWVSLFLGFIQ